MKTLTTLIALSPAAALAHGAHAPVPDAVHGLVHSGLTLGLAVLVIALLAGLARRFLS